jgi:uncharacterized protein YjlB
MIEKTELIEPEQFVFEDDGTFPNSVLPVLFYRQALSTSVENPARFFERRFAGNDWTNSWRNGVYLFAHYHSTSHELLAVYRDSAKLRLGGDGGRTFDVQAGDVLVIPAGVAHQNLGCRSDFAVLGAYAEGRDWDLLRGRPGERPQADQNIAALPLPENDPIYGAGGPLMQIWKSINNRAHEESE